MYLPAPDEVIWVGVLRLVLEVPASRSLKEKRKVVASVRDRLRARSHLSVAEVGHLDDRRRSVMAVAMVSNDSKLVRSALDGLAAEVSGWGQAHVLDAEVDVFQGTSSWDD